MKPITYLSLNLRVHNSIPSIAIVSRGLFLLLIGCLFLLTGCKKETEVNPGGTITANAGPDQSVQVGQTVNLDGSASTDSQGKPLSYQ